MNNQTSRVGKEHILEIAEQLFTERGYRAVSIRAIAEACGVTNAALYYHFDNKEALFLAVIKQHAERLGERLRSVSEKEGSYRERVTSMAKEYMVLMSNRRSLLYLLRHKRKDLQKEHCQENRQEHFIEIFNTAFGPIDEVLGEAVEAGELRMISDDDFATFILLNMLHGLIGYRKIRCQEDLGENDVQLVIDLFWNGMRAAE